MTNPFRREVSLTAFVRECEKKGMTEEQIKAQIDALAARGKKILKGARTEEEIHARLDELGFPVPKDQ